MHTATLCLTLMILNILSVLNASEVQPSIQLSNHYIIETMPYKDVYIFKTNDSSFVINLIQGDITHQKTDAIVNAANDNIIGYSGVAKAIFDKAGRDLLKDYVKKNFHQKPRCKTGSACATDSFNLQDQGIKKIIHAVGPIGTDKNLPMTEEQKKLLASSYQESLKVADALNLTSISFPFISSGIFACNSNDACAVALHAILEYYFQNPKSSIKQIDFVLFDFASLQLFSDTAHKIYN